jgi:hypothetical protein
MNITQQVIILSAEKSENTPERNRQLTASLGGMLADLNINAQQAEGSFNGHTQASFVAIVKDEAEIEAVKGLALNPVGHGGFGQDAILYQDANQEAYLLDKSGGTIQLGRLEQVNPKEIERLENYTVLNGKVYTTVKR